MFVWNPHGFQVVDAYYIRNIFIEIAARRGERGEWKLAAHAGKARPHTVRVRRAFGDENCLRITSHPHPPYSPDLAPSDFFLFRHLKNRLQGQQLGSGDELLWGVRKILEEISFDTSEMVVREWINRLD
jgi:hypothetical protein